MNGSRVFVLSLLSSFAFTSLALVACTEAPAADQFTELESRSKPAPKADDDDADDDEDDDDDTVESKAPAPKPTTVPNDAGAPKKDASPPVTTATCCEGKGTCVPAAAVPAEAAAKLKQDSCKAENLCAPTESLGGAPPAKCTAKGPFGKSGAGVCVSTCVDMGDMGAQFKQDDCTADHKSVPCMMMGQSTGLPGCE